MPGRKNTATKTQNQKYEFEVLSVLSESPVALTIPEICEKNMLLVGLSSQKMARILSDLVNMGLVRKSQSKAKGNRMIYMAESQLKYTGED